MRGDKQKPCNKVMIALEFLFWSRIWKVEAFKPNQNTWWSESGPWPRCTAWETWRGSWRSGGTRKFARISLRWPWYCWLVMISKPPKCLEGWSFHSSLFKTLFMIMIPWWKLILKLGSSSATLPPSSWLPSSLPPSSKPPHYVVQAAQDDEGSPQCQLGQLHVGNVPG